MTGVLPPTSVKQCLGPTSDAGYSTIPTPRRFCGGTGRAIGKLFGRLVFGASRIHHYGGLRCIGASCLVITPLSIGSVVNLCCILFSLMVGGVTGGWT